MATLSTDLRNDLGKVIVAARREAEAGARMALQSLAVERHEPHGSMSPGERVLRNRLRARGRQLGDVRDKGRGTQSIDRLVHEVAYEHWHRMLFARFLAENDLLIEPEHGVAISMEDCEDLARESGEDPHAMAARFAQQSLPQIFRTDDPVLELSLAPESRQALERLLDSLSADIFTADDSLGWTYQFWQTEKKAAVNEAGNRIGADELPAVTQLFTEHYMVLFLYHNTIGAWHAGKVLTETPSLAETAQSEEELRHAVRLRSLGGYDFDYLRFVREPRASDGDGVPTGPWRPAASTFDGWPNAARDLRIFDPCCGSGHFLTEGLELLVRLRIDQEELEVEDAIERVLTDNLHGLEIDPRCTQIAAFNLAMAAWKMAGKPAELPPLHVACSGMALGSTRQEWTALAGDDGRLRGGIERLYDLFDQAPDLGSLIDPKALRGDVLVADFAALQPLLERALGREADNVEHAERAVAAQGMARSAEIISGEYTLTITNVPYLARRFHGDTLAEFLEAQHSDSAADLASSFVDRLRRLRAPGGTVATVSPQNWLFLKSYEKFRARLLRYDSWNVVALLGAGAFSGVSGEVVKAQLCVLTHSPGEDRRLALIDVSSETTPEEKARRLVSCAPSFVLQSDAEAAPGSRVTAAASVGSTLLSDVARSYQGMSTADNPRFRRLFWESSELLAGWRRQISSTSPTSLFGGREYVVDLASLEVLGRDYGAALRGREVWRRPGVAIRQTVPLYATLYTGECFDISVHVVAPDDASMLAPIWEYCSSEQYYEDVSIVDRKRNVTTATIVQVPFDIDHWKDVAAKAHPEGLPEPYSDDVTQWLFHGHPAMVGAAGALQAAVGRLAGYRWPAELDSEMHLADEAREWLRRSADLEGFADEDGIVCLAATRGERSAAERLRGLLTRAFGSDWSSAKERDLLTSAGNGKKTAASLEAWLRDKFFEEHCKVFHNRPFLWHIWDGHKDGFHCLVNAHKLTGPDGEGRRTLEAITYSYLGDWIDRQKADQREGKEGADARLSAAQDLQGQLEQILGGEPPYDIFVRWKPLHEQACGWEPHINDGVRLNIRPFMKAKLRKGGKKGAGILRWKPNIKWAKDRGKEPESLRPVADFPWFWGCTGDGNQEERTDFAGAAKFDGNRWNDLHYSNAFKQAARERAAEEVNR